METLTSPPWARIRPIRSAASVSDDTGRVPSQVGLQPPPERMNANWNAFWPVASMTVIGSGGALSNGIRYGAEAYQLSVSAALALWALTNPTSVAPPMATAVAARLMRDLRCTGAPGGRDNAAATPGGPATAVHRRRPAVCGVRCQGWRVIA